MRALLIAAVAFLVAGAAWGAEKPLPVLVKNPSLTVQAADAGRYTHVGQRPGRVVNLVFHSVDTNFFVAPFRINPETGGTTGTPFVVPEGFVFVLTDVQGRRVCRPGFVDEFILFAAAPQLGQVIRDRSGDLPCPDTGGASIDRHYGTGLIFSAGTHFFVPVDSLETMFWGQGYLVPAD